MRLEPASYPRNTGTASSTFCHPFQNSISLRHPNPPVLLRWRRKLSSPSRHRHLRFLLRLTSPHLEHHASHPRLRCLLLLRPRAHASDPKGRCNRWHLPPLRTRSASRRGARRGRPSGTANRNGAVVINGRSVRAVDQQCSTQEDLMGR